ncbi:MAG: preprotein translocase subunit SecE [Gammaproteobacteria bacterium]|nr:preprotein translocase subunit SecE [Gammaproteobacteria bacterium]
MADRIKLIVALLLVGGGVGAFYYFSDQSLLVRVLGLLAIIGVAVAIALQSDAGRGAWAFFKEARTEVRKVVWPTRQETSTTTLMIFAAVIVIGLFLWGVDTLLLWGVQVLTGQGS